MKKIFNKFTIIKINLIISMAILFASCATSMSPIEVNNTLPTLTKSKFISQSQVEEFINKGKCKYLFKGRSYNAPMGYTTNSDLKNGAQGIDEWVKLDGGNAYVLTNYKWVAVGSDGSTQLYIEFDTVLCE
jgi:hypothetical protein